MRARSAVFAFLVLAGFVAATPAYSARVSLADRLHSVLQAYLKERGPVEHTGAIGLVVEPEEEGREALRRRAALEVEDDL